MLSFLPTPYLALGSRRVGRGHPSSPDGARRAAMVAAILLACAPFALIRTAGISGGAGSEFHWRWTPTPEQRLLAQGGDEPKPLPPPAAAAVCRASCRDCPRRHRRRQRQRDAGSGSRDSSRTRIEPTALGRDGDAGRVARLSRARCATASFAACGSRPTGRQSPPVEMWRRPIGPGWSSFAVRGDLLYTQEQRGDDEIVACYSVSTGEPVWRHRDAVRFWESNGGAGPRATPTLSNGRVYTLRRDRNPERARRRHRRGRVVAQRGDRHRREDPGRGASRARRWWSTTSSSSPRPARSPPTTSRPASRAGSVRSTAAATARRSW